MTSQLSFELSDPYRRLVEDSRETWLIRGCAEREEPAITVLHDEFA
jgi:hypothetical protein